MWEIEKHDSTDDAYILRHLMSGMTLGVRTEDEEPISSILVDIYSFLSSCP